MEYIGENKKYTHLDANGDNFVTRIKALDSSIVWTGENISLAYSKPAAILALWIVDEHWKERYHRNFILSDDFTQVGCGVSKYGGIHDLQLCDYAGY